MSEVEQSFAELAASNNLAVNERVSEVEQSFAELAVSNNLAVNERVSEVEQSFAELASVRSQLVSTGQGVIEREVVTYTIPVGVTEYALPNSPGSLFASEDIVHFRIIRESGSFILKREDFEDRGTLLFKAPIPSGNEFIIIITYEKQS